MADHGLIEGALFAYRSVEDLDVDQKATLLDQAHNDGWAFLTRTIQHFPQTNPKGETVGEDLVEYWFFRRRNLG